jgi:hypothetical protein
MVAHRALFALLLLVAAACSKKADQSAGAAQSGKVASCNMPTLQSCREYRGGNLALGTEHLTKLCAIGNFTLTETPCPTEGVIGVCAMNEGTDFFYGDYAIPASELESSCKERGGTFRAR